MWSFPAMKPAPVTVTPLTGEKDPSEVAFK
jgi:hypothetical protein